MTYCKRSSAGPPFNTSLTAIDGSPVAKWGLSRPPDTAIPIQKIYYLLNAQISNRRDPFKCFTYQSHSQLHGSQTQYDTPKTFDPPKNRRIRRRRRKKQKANE